MRQCKMFLALTGSIVLFGAMTTSATARELTVSGFAWEAHFREITFQGAFGRARCFLTLHGSLHSRTIRKVAGTLVGFIDAVIRGSCAEGAATILSETLPWHIKYTGFSGRLPDITSMRSDIIGWSVRIREGIAPACLARSTAAEPVTLSIVASRGELIETSIGGSIRTGAECGGSTGTYSGTSSFERASGGFIVISLI